MIMRTGPTLKLLVTPPPILYWSRAPAETVQYAQASKGDSDKPSRAAAEVA